MSEAYWRGFLAGWVAMVMFRLVLDMLRPWFPAWMGGGARPKKAVDTHSG